VPLSVSVPKKTDLAVVESIDSLLGGVLKKLRGGIQRLSKACGLMICELVSVDFSVNTSAIKVAIKEKRFDADKARELGLEVVEPWDRVVYTLPEVDLAKIS
jgi:protoporphyrinogen oxidase